MTTTKAHARTSTTHQRTPTTGNAPRRGQKSGQKDGRQGGQGVWQVLDEAADVRFLPSGLPLALRWRGGLWQVIGTPASWSHPGNRPELTSPPAPAPAPAAMSVPLPGPVSGGAAIRFWRFQAQTGPASPVLEFEMSAHPHSTVWRLCRVTTVDDF